MVWSSGPGLRPAWSHAVGHRRRSGPFPPPTQPRGRLRHLCRDARLLFCAILEGFHRVFQRLFPAHLPVLQRVHPGHRGQCSLQSAGADGRHALPAGCPCGRPRRPLWGGFCAPPALPVPLHSGHRLHHHLLHPALLGGKAAAACHSAGAHGCRAGQALGDVAQGHHGHVQRPQLQSAGSGPALRTGGRADAGACPSDGSGRNGLPGRLLCGPAA